MSDQPPSDRTKPKSWLRELAESILPALVIVLVVNVFLAQATRVEGQSMEPNLYNNERLIIEKITYRFREPQRGDIVVLRPPQRSTVPLIKRVIGLPGDTVEIKDGYVYINGEPLTEDYVAERPNYQFGPVTVPEGCYFMMGDNRNTSYDSHRWLNAFVPEQDIKGKAVWRYWPLDKMGGIYDHEDTADQ